MGPCTTTEHETLGTPPAHNRQLSKKNVVCTVYECEMTQKGFIETGACTDTPQTTLLNSSGVTN